MKILFVHNNYGNNNSGEEHASQSLADLLEVNGHTIKWYRKSSDIIRDSYTKKIAAFFLALYNPKTLKELKRHILEFEPDIIQVQNMYPFISPAILPMIKKLNIPIVLRCPNYRLFCPTGLHLGRKGNICEKCLKGSRELNAILNNCEGNFFKSTGYALRNFVGRKIWKISKHVDAYIVQSDFQKQKFITNGIEESKIFIVPGQTPRLPSPDLNSEVKYVSFVGRASAEKGIVEFFNAAKGLPNIRFKVVGTLDPSLKYLRHESPSNIIWPGFLSGKDYDKIYRQSKIIVVPSKWYEGFPNVITRAMRYGKPVIASDIGAIQSIVENNVNGILVPPGDVGLLKDAIEGLYYDDKKCIILGKQGKQKAEKLYHDDKIYEELSGIYNFVLSSVIK